MIQWIYIAAVCSLLVLALLVSGCAVVTDLDCSMKASEYWAQWYMVKDGRCYIGPSALPYMDPRGYRPLWCMTTGNGMTVCQ